MEFLIFSRRNRSQRDGVLRALQGRAICSRRGKCQQFQHRQGSWYQAPGNSGNKRVSRDENMCLIFEGLGWMWKRWTAEENPEVNNCLLLRSKREMHWLRRSVWEGQQVSHKWHNKAQRRHTPGSLSTPPPPQDTSFPRFPHLLS